MGPQGRFHRVCDGQQLESGISTRVTARATDDSAPRPEACVFSPNGRQIAYVRRMPHGATQFNQIFTVTLD
jgi:hypothetical protein